MKRSLPPQTPEREAESEIATHNRCSSSALPYGNWGAVSALGLQLESVEAWEM